MKNKLEEIIYKENLNAEELNHLLLDELIYKTGFEFKFYGVNVFIGAWPYQTWTAKGKVPGTSTLIERQGNSPLEAVRNLYLGLVEVKKNKEEFNKNIK